MNRMIRMEQFLMAIGSIESKDQHITIIIANEFTNILKTD